MGIVFREGFQANDFVINRDLFNLKVIISLNGECPNFTSVLTLNSSCCDETKLDMLQ